MSLPDDVKALAAEVSNWGRWGDDDERGTVNLLDAVAVRRGVEAVVDGRTFRLAMPLDGNGPQTGSIPGRLNPTRTLTAHNTAYTGDSDDFCTSDDIVVMGLQAATHWDALAHVSYEGLLYNGFPAESVTVEAGATRCGIDKVGAVVGRGVLLDVARAREVERLDPGYAIAADDLDAAERLAGVEVVGGDIVLVRTGHIGLWREGKRRAYTEGDAPGLSLDTVRWLRTRDVAAVATDTLVFEVWPSEPGTLLPVHLLHLRDMGLLQGQNWDLDALAADCAADGRHGFLLEATPEPFTGALGSPVQPVAVK